MQRRDLLIAGAAAFTGLAAAAGQRPTLNGGRRATRGIPIVHITDLYHPPQDPDDHIDLATLVALEEFDLRGVILDVTRKFLMSSPEGFDIRRDPGFVPVVQLCYLLGRAIPVAAGPTQPLAHPGDTVTDRPRAEQSGVQLLLDILEESRDKIVVSVVGSTRVLAAAYNRNPELVRARIRSVLLNAGSTGGAKQEWNVGLDPEAFVGVWRSGLPIHWYPCATEGGAFNADHERGTYWKTDHAAIFRDLSPSLRAWFAYAIGGDTRGDIIGALANEVTPASWDHILDAHRNMWATASLVMAAGRVLTQTPQGWRFVPRKSVGSERIWTWRLDPIVAGVNESAEVQWRGVKKEGNALLFWRERGSEYAAAMAEALCALLGTVSPAGA